ncbi:MAG: HEAT repeat domain-containing protein [Planctomycetota bacterium]
MKNIIAIIFSGVLLVAVTSCSSIKVSDIASPNPDYRKQALDVMASDKEPAQYFGVFMEVLEKDGDAMARAQAAYYLGNFQHKPALPLLIKATEDSSVFVKQEAVWALGEIKDNSALPTLLTLLEKNSNIEVRKRAADGLKKINDPKAVDGLIEQLDDINQTVAYAALQALKVITKQDFGRDIKQWEKWREDKKPK